MLVPMLVNQLITLSYHGDNTHGTVEFENTGGTDAGKLILKNGTDTVEIDLGTEDTIEKLELKILETQVWKPLVNMNMNRSSEIKTANFTRRPLSSMAERNVVQGEIVAPILFSETHEVMAANAENNFQTPLLFNTSHIQNMLVTIHAKSVSAGDDEKCEVFFGTAGYDKLDTGKTLQWVQPDFHPRSGPESIDWDNNALFNDSILFELNGTTLVKVSKQFNLAGINFFYLRSFENGAGNNVQIKAFI